eukprot:CAMPEP_0116854748 /NCGR_PEP_ID=MMETSP0418-20121206/18811_1 /TAXON_ID=1158023 /ORGANISM="Astrosyne radiata, Strain 13vi08-1A" /LENGTH=301 /DNA_ID=CAMNT_0004487637 /DNA_START=86 /DNA_END=991 /DNA_ORIENTATION=-
MSGHAKKMPGMERTSSFAQSFYHNNDGGGGGGEMDGGSGSFPVPKSRRMGRRQSSRPRISLTPPSMSSSAAAAAANFRDDEPGNVAYGAGTAAAAAKMAPPEGAGGGGGVDRAHSWYVDALRQQGGTAANLDEILGAAQSEGSGFDDDEVLEQYRIMAQHEANLRVKENTGFDMAEYEKRRKMQGEAPKDKKGLYGGGKKPKIRLPDQVKITSSSAGGSAPKPEEPPLPAPKFSCRFLEQKTARVPELCPGTAARGGSNLKQDEHVVRCIGCRSQLRVNVLATLVSCPDCSTVSPASSTRR